MNLKQRPTAEQCYLVVVEGWSHQSREGLWSAPGPHYFRSWPLFLRVSTNAQMLIVKLLRPDPSQRPTAEQCLKEDFFTSGYTPKSLPVSCLMMPPHFDTKYVIRGYQGRGYEAFHYNYRSDPHLEVSSSSKFFNRLILMTFQKSTFGVHCSHKDYRVPTHI